MQADTRHKQPNACLRYERETRGWTQQYVAEQLGADMNIISRWESGERKPGSYYRQKLMALFGKSAVELGLMKAHVPSDLSSTSSHLASAYNSVPGAITTDTGAADDPLDKQTVRSTYSTPVAKQESLIARSGSQSSFASLEAPLGLMRTHQSLDFLHATTEGTSEQRLGAWLALGASDLVQLFEEGWTLEEVFTTLQVLQKRCRSCPRLRDVNCSKLEHSHW